MWLYDLIFDYFFIKILSVVQNVNDQFWARQKLYSDQDILQYRYSTVEVIGIPCQFVKSNCNFENSHDNRIIGNLNKSCLDLN